MIGDSSTSTHSVRNLVEIGSKGQEFLDEAVIRSNTSDSDNRLNSEKQEAVAVLVALIVIGRQIWFSNNRPDINNFLGEEFSKIISQLIIISRCGKPEPFDKFRKDLLTLKSPLLSLLFSFMKFV